MALHVVTCSNVSGVEESLWKKWPKKSVCWTLDIVCIEESDDMSEEAPPEISSHEISCIPSALAFRQWKWLPDCNWINGQLPW